MKLGLMFAAALALLALPMDAAAQVVRTSQTATGSGTIVASGVSQVALPANASRAGTAYMQIATALIAAGIKPVF